MWEKLALLLAVSVSLSAANCRIGPSYWCASIPQAAQCSAVPFCIQAVWSKERVHKDTDEVCEICKDMVGQARDTLQSNETQEELREVFEGSCDLIPIKVVRKECKVLADEFVPELVETLSSEMNPDTVCTVAGLCNSQRIDEMLEKLYSKSGHCDVCKTKMSKANNYLKSTSDAEVQGRLYEVCGQLGSYSDACVYTVSTQLPLIRSMLEAGISPDSCTQSVCTAKDIVMLAKGEGEDIECEFCEKVIKHWIDVYASDSSLEEFKEILDGLCEKLDTKRSAHCKHIVDDYYMPLFNYIKNVDPHMICSLVGICHNGYVSNKSSLPLASLFPEQKTLPLTPLTPAAQSQTTDKSSCLLCEFAMQKLETFLQDKHTSEEVKDYLDGLCNDVPSSYTDACKEFVDVYEPIIMDMIASEVHPAQICKKMKLCASAPPPKPPKKSASCETCHIVAEEIFSVFSSKDDQDMVKNVLEGICYRFPEYIDEPCERFVDKYTTAFLDFVAKGLTPDEVCDALDLCSAQDDLIGVLREDDVSVDDSACIICEYVISYLDKALTNKTNEDEIKEAMEAVCDYLPSNVKDQCDTFVDAYTDMIIQLLTGEITPKELCGYLGLCQNNDLLAFQNVPGPVMLSNTMDIDFRVETSNGKYCTMCEYLITTIDQMLEDKKTEKEIEVSLDKVCYLLPESVKQSCLDIVNAYTDQIIHLLVNDYPPEEVCTKLSLCTNNY